MTESNERFHPDHVDQAFAYWTGSFVVLVLVGGLLMAAAVYRSVHFASRDVFGGIRVVEKIPSPRLQPHEGDESQAYLERQEKLLNSRAWVDRSRGLVRIPIDEAIDQVVEKGLGQKGEAHANR